MSVYARENIFELRILEDRQCIAISADYSWYTSYFEPCVPINLYSIFMGERFRSIVAKVLDCELEL